MLSDLCDDRITDKNTIHSYIEAYEELFSSKKDSATHVLEIGIGPEKYMNGGSIKMWSEYFLNADIHALDIIPIDNVNPILIFHPRIYLHTSTDAYNMLFFKNRFLSKSIKFDILIDDGPHTVDSVIFFVKTYSRLLKDDGILVIEDIQHIEWIDALRHHAPAELHPYIEVYDRRNIKGRYDDILFVINKTKQL